MLFKKTQDRVEISSKLNFLIVNQEKYYLKILIKICTTLV